MDPPASIKTLLRKTLRIILLLAFFMATAVIGAYLALNLIIKGADTVVVPELVGKDVLYGLEILSDLGLNTRVRATLYHDQVPKNHVIDQDPEAGATIKRGRDIKIRVSRGPETIVMPNLAGLSLQQSRVLLIENGLCQGTLSAMPSARHAVSQIIAHVPPPGATVTRNTCADLLVSQGPALPEFAMLDLSGFTLESAIRRLEKLQLTVGTIHQVHRAGAPPETVVNQLPLAGHRVVLGSRVDLTVNRHTTGQSADSSRSANEVALFRYALENGFLKKRVQVKINQSQMTFSLFDDFMAPGQEIWLLIPKSDNPTVLVYVDSQLVETRLMDGG
jgi:serine/threonine-protein kinase